MELYSRDLAIVLETAYPYLWASLVAAGVALALIALVPKHRYPMLVSGAISGSIAWCGFTLEDVYWSPSRVGGGAVGIEDFLMAAAVGSISWCLAALPSYLPFHNLSWRREVLAGRLIGGLTVGVAVYLGFWLTGFPAMTLYLGIMSTVAAGILVWRPSLFPFAISGALGFSLFWIIMVTICFALWPDSVLVWNHASVWGQPIFDVPLGELAWAAAFGFSCPLFAAFVLDAQFSKSSKSRSHLIEDRRSTSARR